MSQNYGLRWNKRDLFTITLLVILLSKQAFKLYTHKVISGPYMVTEITFVLVWSKNTVTEPVDSVAVYGNGNGLF